VTRKPNPNIAANGISAKEYADAVRDAVRTGGGSKKEANRAGGNAHKSATGGGAKKK
jgi:hypothetical protein